MLWLVFFRAMVLANLSNAQVTFWTSVAAVGGALLSALITFTVTGRSIRATERLETFRRQHEKDLARDERQQRRREDAYLALLASLEVGRLRLSRLRPGFGSIPHPEPPAMPSTDEWVAIEARVGAFGSEDVKAEYQRWWTAFARFELDRAVERRSDAPGLAQKRRRDPRHAGRLLPAHF